MICKNCENKFEGDFCNNCGQKSNTKRVDFNYLINEISNSFLQVNRGIFFTIKELSIRPGKSIRDYINGKRKQHYKPLAFLLLISTIYVLFTNQINKSTLLGGALSGMISGLSDNKETTSIDLLMFQNIIEWFLKNQTYTTLLLLPLFSFASYIAFIKSKYNYFEHLILSFYITGQQTIIYLFFYFIFFIFRFENDNLLYYPQMILSTAYLFWVYIKFFNTKKVFSTIMFTILSNLLYYFLILIAIICILILTIIYHNYFKT